VDPAPPAQRPGRRWKGRILRYQYIPVGVAGGFLLSGVLSMADTRRAVSATLPSLLVIASVMVITECARRLGVMDGMASGLLRMARGSRWRLYCLVFLLSAATASALNNDSAVLLLAPVVVVVARRCYPTTPDSTAILAMVVFMAAGVAPLVVSNPMNLIVAQYAGLGFNQYARHMIPVALAGWAAAFGAMLWAFRRRLAIPPDLNGADRVPERRHPGAVRATALLVLVLASYPVAAALQVPLAAVGALGGLAFLLLCARHGGGSPWQVAAAGIAWEILVFLAAVSIVGRGLAELGVVDRLRTLYGEHGTTGIAAVSALGSAVLNNHPMSLLNVLALKPVDPTRPTPVLAALVGGNLGPRLLPWGSLAGLLWFRMMKDLQVDVSLRRFMAVGALLTLVSMPLCLLVLAISA
jgi:arsenical pump membrane protein